MTEAALPLPPEPPRRLHFDWLIPALFKPRDTFAKIAAYEHGAWLTPLLLLTILALVRVVIAGPLLVTQMQSAPVTPPEGFETWPPEQQQQFFEAQSQAQGLTSGPIFIYVFPAVIAFFGTWIGWLVMFGLLHLLLTLLGGRGSTRSSMNVVAWASMPFALRDLLRIGYMLITQKLITAPGISGFAPSEGFGLVLASLLQNVDIYLIWFVILVVLGITVSDKMSGVKALSGILVTLLVLGVLAAIPAIIGVFLSSSSGSSF